jgi:beta-glucanase (GH16 family)
MKQHEADTAGTQPERRESRGVSWLAALAVAALATLALSTVSCAPATGGGALSGETSVTVIATAAVVPTTPPVALDPLTTPGKIGYRLVFSDEFVGPRFDAKRWATSLPWGNTNRNEQQYYTADALSQSGGVLAITASKRPAGGKPYTSGVISTSKRFLFTYGYTEIRAQVPAGNGLWSAFWVVSPQPGSNEEVDVMEVLGSDPSLGYAVLHYGTMADKGKSLSTYRDPDFSTGFHTFAVDWEPESMVWYVDGVERYRVSQNIPKDRMYLIANLAVGGKETWSGPPNRYTEFPAQLKIDYIRVYQRDGQPAPAAGP